MRFHEPIIALRRRHCKPAAIFLVVDSTLREEGKPENGDPELPVVAIEPEDRPHRLDLRFLVGCRVIVQGADPERTRAVFTAACDAGARTVFAVIGDELQTHHREPPAYTNPKEAA